MANNITIALRPATKHDADLLLTWRNEHETRKFSHHTAKVKKEEHIAWLLKVLADTSRKLFIAEENGIPVGTIRADWSEGAWELSWTVSPAARGRGVAKQMVILLAHQLSEPIRAEVKVGNTISCRIAEYAGLKFEKEAAGILYYRRESL